jgi:hypothetical protein
MLVTSISDPDLIYKNIFVATGIFFLPNPVSKRIRLISTGRTRVRSKWTVLANSDFKPVLGIWTILSDLDPDPSPYKFCTNVFQQEIFGLKVTFQPFFGMTVNIHVFLAQKG